MENCKKCNELTTGNYCSNCGTPTQVNRIDRHHLVHEFEHYILHYEKGILFTLKELALNPGKAIRNFINGDRANFYKPIGFLILTSGLYTLLDHYMGYHPSEVAHTAQNASNSFMRQHLVYFSLLQIIISAFLIKYVIYKSKPYNIYEYLVVLSYSSAMTILFSSFGIILAKLTNIEFAQYLISFMGLAYGVWLLGQFMEASNFKGYFKAFATKMLSMLIFMILATVFFTVIVNVGLKF